MRAFIIIFVLLTASLYADSKIYLGIDYGSFNEKFDNLKAKTSSDSIKVKVGYGIREAYAIEFSVESIKNESKVFSNNDGDKYALNVELVKAFDYDIYILPFIKAGFGAGYMKVDRELQTKLNYGSFSAELGTFIPVNENLDFEIAYNYKNISYESIDTIAEELKYESSVNTFYFGFNVRF